MEMSRVFVWHKLFKREFACRNHKRRQCSFLGIKGIVHFEFIPQGQTVNQAYYVEISKLKLVAVHIKTPELWPNDWIFRHDNAPAHKALCQAFCGTKSITEM
jgi:hypothetical protein